MEKRVIKFRAWDTFNECHHEQKDESLEELARFFVMIADFEENENGIILEQFTGYHSGDTLEMYEGDKICIGMATAEIAWGDDGFVFVNQNEHWLDDWNLPDDSHRMKIIGHIHETN